MRSIGFQLKHIGDLLMTLPALGLIKNHRPESRTALLVTPQTAPLVTDHPWVDDVFVWNYYSRSIGDLRAVCRAVRKAGYETGFFFDGQSRSVVAGFLCGLKARWTDSLIYARSGQYRRLYTGRVDLPEDSLRLMSLNLRGQHLAAGALKLEPDPELRPIPPRLTPDHHRTAAALLAEHPGRGPQVILSLQGRQYEKSWPLGHFAAVVRGLRRELGARIYVVGGPDERPLAHTLSRLAGEPVADLCGRTSLKDLIALLAAADLFLGIDTGTGHLAALTGTPLISLFVCTNPALWSPQSSQSRILCYNWALARFGLRPEEGPWRTAAEITPEMVLEEARRLVPVSSNS